MTDSATFTTPEAGDKDSGNPPLEVLRPDGSTIRHLSALEALGRGAERQINGEEDEPDQQKAELLQ